MQGSRLAIIAGGSEQVALAVAESAWLAGMEFTVLTLNSASLLGQMPGCISVKRLAQAGGAKQPSATDLLKILNDMAAEDERRLIVLPTEDDGLNLLVRCRSNLSQRVHYSWAHAVPMGGTEKQQLYEWAERNGITNVAPGEPLRSPADISDFRRRWGSKLVVKPSSKPWGRVAGPNGSKVLSSLAFRDAQSFQTAVSKAWPQADQWVIQPYLGGLNGYERSVIVVRGLHTRCLEITERWKAPKQGGSTVWAAICPPTAALDAAEHLAERMNLQGIAEMAFLSDQDGHPQLLELNLRPWLQFEFAARRAPSLLSDLVAALNLEDKHSGWKQISSKSPENWLHLERALIDITRRPTALIHLFKALLSRPMFAVHQSPISATRRIWRRNLCAAVKQRIKTLIRR